MKSPKPYLALAACLAAGLTACATTTPQHADTAALTTVHFTRPARTHPGRLPARAAPAPWSDRHRRLCRFPATRPHPLPSQPGAHQGLPARARDRARPVLARRRGRPTALRATDHQRDRLIPRRRVRRPPGSRLPAQLPARRVHGWQATGLPRTNHRAPSHSTEALRTQSTTRLTSDHQPAENVKDDQQMARAWPAAARATGRARAPGLRTAGKSR